MISWASVILGDGPVPRSITEHPIEDFTDDSTGHSKPGLQRRTVAAPVISHGRWASVSDSYRGIMDETRAPAFRGVSRVRAPSPVEREYVLPTDRDGLQLRMRPIQPTHPLAINQPAFAPEQYPDLLVAEPPARIRDLAHAQPRAD